jgi:hypothetical protein
MRQACRHRHGRTSRLHGSRPGPTPLTGPFRPDAAWWREERIIINAGEFSSLAADEQIIFT